MTKKRLKEVEKEIDRNSAISTLKALLTVIQDKVSEIEKDRESPVYFLTGTALRILEEDLIKTL